MSFSENLKQIRKEHHLSQEELAELLDVSRQAVSKWEQGQGYPEVEKLLMISQKLNISLDELMESEDGDIFDVADPRSEFENSVISEMQIASFAESTITEKDREILKLRMEGYTEQEIADKVGYKTASAVHKRIAKIADAYEDFVTAEYQKYLDK